MSESTLHIKNMVCPRCILAVKDILENLSIPFSNIQLGQVDITEKVTSEQIIELSEQLESIGFELLEPGKSSLISQIKTVIIDQIHYQKEPISINFSALISEKLHHEYSSLSRLFSSVEGMTIEKFIALQRIEKVKEYLIYNELTLSEIADQMNYSSVSHLSAQFKKETGMTPTQFKSQAKPSRNSLDDLHS